MTNPKVSTLCDFFDQGAINTNLWTTPTSMALGTVATYSMASVL